MNEDRIVKLTLDENDLPTRDDVSLSSLYTVEPVYNAQGYIIGLEITTK
jgi:hypothetical protein